MSLKKKYGVRGRGVEGGGERGGAGEKMAAVLDSSNFFIKMSLYVYELRFTF